ncbi:MAG: HEPN domain-containing protein [Sphingobacteriia bacterium]|nr:MAG: HEPN domain-containing protein [Sphingobacteriia bacterium]TAG30522.1 MAG: HEPN domain-containing protein [Sphingobacteriia bacterium]TAH08529.1 MAG: HEPN domain-containing protein [Sphingobacteriia bacterium]
MILYNACFHCQQAIEKPLKAFLISKGMEIEKSNNIQF